MIKMFQVETSQEKEERLHEVARNVERIYKFYKYYFTDEVERLLRDYKQNQELLRRLGNRYYQVVYPIQVRQ